MFYFSHIRQLICDKLEHTNIFDEYIENRSEYVKKMRNDKEYGSFLEIRTFCEIFKIKIIIYIRNIIDENYLKQDTDLLDTYIAGEKYKGNFGLIFDRYAEDKAGIYNHYSDLYPKENICISDEKLENIRNEIINKYPNIKIDYIISGRTGKKVGSRKGKSDRNLYNILSRMNKEKNTFNYYIVVTKNNEIKNGNIANYTDLVNYTKLSDIIDKFKAENIRKNGVNNILENYYNILIDNIKIKDKIRPLRTDDFGSILNLNDELTKEFTRCICYECSGLNDKGKKLYKIYQSFYELKNHCIDKHSKELNNCNINYTLADNHEEFHHNDKKYKYIMNLDDMLTKDKNYILLKNIKGGYNPFNYYHNINKIKILGENIYILNETNRALLSDVLDKHRPDFILLNECNKGKVSFNMSGYNLILSRNQEVGMIYRNLYFLNDVFNDIEDDYNIIRLVNSKINKFIIFVTYIPPNEEHDNRLSLLIEKLMLLKRRYNNLKLVVIGYLNINSEDLDYKLKNKIEPFRFKICYKKREYTRIQKVKDVEKKLYLDYFITYGLENINFNIIDKLVLSLEFFEDKNIKLERMKELIEPYSIAQIKMDEISEKLKDAFFNDITEIKIKKLIPDNTFNYKTKIRKFKFNTNKIEKIADKIKELQK